MADLVVAGVYPAWPQQPEGVGQQVRAASTQHGEGHVLLDVRSTGRSSAGWTQHCALGLQQASCHNVPAM